MYAEDADKFVKTVQNKFAARYNMDESYGRVNSLERLQFVDADGHPHSNVVTIIPKEKYNEYLQRQLSALNENNPNSVEEGKKLLSDLHALAEKVNTGALANPISDALTTMALLKAEAIRYKENMDKFLKENKDLTTTGYLLVNPDKDSHVGANIELLTSQFKNTVKTTTIGGKDLKQDLYDKGIIKNKENTIELAGDVLPYVNRIAGNDMGRTKINIKDASGKVIRTEEVDIDLPLSDATIDDMLKNTYYNTSYDNSTEHSGYAQSEAQRKGTVAKGYADRHIKNMSSLQDITVTKQERMYGSKHNYTVTKSGNGYIISFAAKDGNKSGTGYSPQLRNIETVKEVLGMFELGDFSNVIYK